mmetsp:Transcript_19625/g.62437  ORF Transcript_19625/g.62437 Transcript_19625/m.62437 type:complete len:307 (+) Transcript_19625:127-1047(+)
MSRTGGGRRSSASMRSQRSCFWGGVRPPSANIRKHCTGPTVAQNPGLAASGRRQSILYVSAPFMDLTISKNCSSETAAWRREMASVSRYGMVAPRTSLRMLRSVRSIWRSPMCPSTWARSSTGRDESSSAVAMVPPYSRCCRTSSGSSAARSMAVIRLASSAGSIPSTLSSTPRNGSSCRHRSCTWSQMTTSGVNSVTPLSSLRRPSACARRMSVSAVFSSRNVLRSTAEVSSPSAASARSFQPLSSSSAASARCATVRKLATTSRSSVSLLSTRALSASYLRSPSQLRAMPLYSMSLSVSSLLMA